MVCMVIFLSSSMIDLKADIWISHYPICLRNLVFMKGSRTKPKHTKSPEASQNKRS